EPEPEPKPEPPKDPPKEPNPQPRGSKFKPFAGIIAFQGHGVDTSSYWDGSSTSKTGFSYVYSIKRLNLLQNPFYDVWEIVSDVGGDSSTLQYPSKLLICFNEAG
ncbi:hypothetical protein, partial [Planktothrix sp.]|uniref:hypothetical protein n=1 Tax=Planktothrix sp. TaxID=3088171 RepID=UPI0038D39157